MVTKTSAPRRGGRPRTYADEEIFAATARNLARVGYGRLTLAEVAAEVGCTRQALVRRFGSKPGLMRAYLGWVAALNTERPRRIRAGLASPLATLRARFLLPVEERPEEISDPAGQANYLASFLEARADPDLRPLLMRLMEVHEREVGALLAAALEADEIIACDTAALAHTLIVATTGEILLWTASPDEPIVDRIAHIFDLVLAPYLPALTPY